MGDGLNDNVPLTVAVSDCVSVGDAVRVDEAVIVHVDVTDAVIVLVPVCVAVHDGAADGVDDGGATASTYGMSVSGTASTSCDPLPNCP